MAITPIHPGEHLAEELKELGMSAAELARQLDVPTNRVTEILNGRRAITGDTALRFAATVQGSWLAHWWRLPPQLFEPVHDRLHFRFAGHSLRLLQHQEALPVRRRVPVPGAQLEQRPWLPGPTSTHL